jgi:hypothetical protein
MRAVLEQRKLRGYDNKMPLEDPEIRKKVLGGEHPYQQNSSDFQSKAEI